MSETLRGDRLAVDAVPPRRLEDISQSAELELSKPILPSLPGAWPVRS
jgi:hypothetical protein